MSMEHKGNSQWSLLGVIGVLLAAIVLVFTQTMNSLNNATSDLTEIQYLGNTSQYLATSFLVKSHHKFGKIFVNPPRINKKF